MATILVIEDSPEIRENIAETYELEGFTVVEASNGLQGIQAALSMSPDLILCAIMMDGVDGFEVLRTVRSSQSTHQIPFIFTSARSDERFIQQSVDMGADEYIVKPFATEMLIALTHRCLKSAGADSVFQELRKGSA